MVVGATVVVEAAVVDTPATVVVALAPVIDELEVEDLRVEKGLVLVSERAKGTAMAAAATSTSAVETTAMRTIFVVEPAAAVLRKSTGE